MKSRIKKEENELMRYYWKVNNLSGNSELSEVNRLRVTLNKARLAEVTATVEVAPSEKMFFNGFQSWSWSPEYSENDIMYPMRLPKGVVNRFSLNRYADYHFAEYDTTRGKFHGYSYCYFRDGDHYKLFASLDESTGYTVFYYDCAKQLLTIKKDTLGVICQGEFSAFDLYYKEGTEQEVFDGWFAQMGIKPITDKKLVGYSSWYNRYENINSDSILEDLEGCKKILKPGDLFQVDDGWEPTVGDWLAPDPQKFPEGMGVIADRIHESGFKAGLWLAPFVCTAKSDIYQNHKDWLLLHDGHIWLNGSNWGGFYSLDIDNEEVQQYLKDVFDRVFDEWGFDLVKLDFLYAVAPFGNDYESRGAIMSKAMKFIRELCRDKAIIGCGVPLMPAFGLVDYCRIGCDVSLNWDDSLLMRNAHRERVSTKHSLDNTIYRRQLNNRAFINDPDVFFLRKDNIKLNEKDKEYLYSVDALLGGVLLTSDNPGKYDDSQVERFNYIRELATSTDQQVVNSDEPHIKFTMNERKYKLNLRKDNRRYVFASVKGK